MAKVHCPRKQSLRGDATTADWASFSNFTVRRFPFRAVSPRGVRPPNARRIHSVSPPCARSLSEIETRILIAIDQGEAPGSDSRRSLAILASVRQLKRAAYFTTASRLT